MTNFKKGNSKFSVALVFAVIALIVVTVVFAIGLPTKTSETDQNTGGPGISNTSSVIKAGTYFTESVNATSTTATSYTLVKKDIENYGTLIITPNTGSLTLTLPATTTLSGFLPRVGQRTEIAIVNGTSTSGQNITIAAGTGTLLKTASSTAIILPGSVGMLNLIRKANGDIVGWLSNAF